MMHEATFVSPSDAGKTLLVAILLALTWFALRTLRRLFTRLGAGNPGLPFLARLEPPLRIIVCFAAFLLCMKVLAPSRDAFLVALGSTALAIALGVQDLIKNLIGGLVLVADRTYQIGDLVRMGDVYGEVVQIGLRSTRLLTSEGIQVSVPNSEIMTGFTYKASGGTPERMVTSELSVPQDSDPDQLLRIGREVGVCCPYTHLGHQVEVELDERSGTTPSTMKLTIKAYVYDHRFESAMQTDILRRVKHELSALGIARFAEPGAGDRHAAYSAPLA